jgi:Delta14-sterol reductase
MLTTWDIINEEFGYMLVFGDYVFIPFVFSVQCHYLLDYDDLSGNLKIITAVLILILYFVGYYIFRSANSQKNQFKIDPKL